MRWSSLKHKLLFENIFVHFFLNNQPDALIIQIYSVIKLYVKILVQSAKDHYWRTVVCAKYGDTTRLKSVLRQTSSAQLQCHLPPPVWRSPQRAG